MFFSNDPKIAAILCLLAGGSLLYRGLKNFQKVRKIQDMACIDIGSAPKGLVELQGYAWPQSELMTDIYDQEVIYYTYKVQKHERSGKHSRWVTKYEFDFDNIFYVMDLSGICLVKPSKNSMDLQENIIGLHNYATDIESLKSATKSKGFFNSIFSGNYRLVEKKILLGSPVYICGELLLLENQDCTIKGDYKNFLERVKLSKNNLAFRSQKFDLNRDGIISEGELQLGLLEAAKTAILSVKHEPIVLSGVVSATENHSLILADCHQDQLLNRTSKYNYFTIIGGIVLIAVGLFILQQIF